MLQNLLLACGLMATLAACTCQDDMDSIPYVELNYTAVCADSTQYENLNIELSEQSLEGAYVITGRTACGFAGCSEQMVPVEVGTAISPDLVLAADGQLLVAAVLQNLTTWRLSNSDDQNPQRTLILENSSNKDLTVAYTIFAAGPCRLVLSDGAQSSTTYTRLLND